MDLTFNYPMNVWGVVRSYHRRYGMGEGGDVASSKGQSYPMTTHLHVCIDISFFFL